jgi:hypothetical protein
VVVCFGSTEARVLTLSTSTLTMTMPSTCRWSLLTNGRLGGHDHSLSKTYHVTWWWVGCVDGASESQKELMSWPRRREEVGDVPGLIWCTSRHTDSLVIGVSRAGSLERCRPIPGQ